MEGTSLLVKSRLRLQDLAFVLLSIATSKAVRLSMISLHDSMLSFCSGVASRGAQESFCLDKSCMTLNNGLFICPPAHGPKCILERSACMRLV